MSQVTERGVIAWFVRNPVAANLLLILVLLLGLFQGRPATARGLSRVSTGLTHHSGAIQQRLGSAKRRRRSD